MMIHWPILSCMIWLPVLGGMIVLLIGGDDKHAGRGRMIALGFALLNMALCIPLYQHFDLTTYAMQFQENISWIPAYGIHYALGVDGISMPLIVLTVFTTLLVILASWQTVHKKVAQYLATFLIMQGMVIERKPAEEEITSESSSSGATPSKKKKKSGSGEGSGADPAPVPV